MAGLVETVRALREERDDLRRELDESNHRALGLEEKLRATNQRRQDAMKRLDDLIAQMDQLDARYEAEARSA